MKSKITVLFIVVILAITASFIWQNLAKSNEEKADIDSNQVIVDPDRRVEIEILPDNTYGILMSEVGVTSTIATDIFLAAEDIYDLSSIRVGRAISLVYDKDTDELKQLIYQIDTEEELFVTRQEEGDWFAERITIPYEIIIKTSAGSIETSMYEAAMEQGIDERAIIDLANVFQWSVDFGLEVKKGDTFKFIYEERYRDGEYVMPGKILVGKFVNADTPYYAFYFVNGNSETDWAYYDEQGNNVQKIFLRAPVAYKYITSGFTTGLRYIKAFNISTGHRAIDYAAPYGTPVRSVGDGTVVLAGWDGSYGRKVSVRHNSTFTTNYAHMSKIAVKYGQEVKQGETIGYVGSSGLSTGAHLHYEMVKYGSKVNPLREVLPPGDPISEENKDKFFNEINRFKDQLDF